MFTSTMIQIITPHNISLKWQNLTFEVAPANPFTKTLMESSGEN